MGDVKDLLFIFVFLLLFVDYLILLNKFKSQKEYFINILKHDLRVSILAQIRGSDLLKKNILPRDEELEIISEVNNSSKISLDMINMLLNSFRYDSKENFLNYEKFNFSNSISNSLKKILEYASSKNIKINYNFQDLPIQADRIEIQKMLDILISTIVINAKINSSININIQSKNSKLITEILYSGKSLTYEEENRMFGKKAIFSTVGHGIKMNLCKKIIDFHNGEIFIKKLSKDKNSFTFILPINLTTKGFKPSYNCFRNKNYNSNIKCFVNNLNNSTFQH